MYNHTTFSAHCICVEIWLELSISSNNSSSSSSRSIPSIDPLDQIYYWIEEFWSRGLFLPTICIQFRIRMPIAYLSSRLSRESALGGTKRILQENFSPFTFCGERKGTEESHSNSFWQDKKLFFFHTKWANTVHACIWIHQSGISFVLCMRTTYSIQGYR